MPTLINFKYEINSRLAFDLVMTDQLAFKLMQTEKKDGETRLGLLREVFSFSYDTQDEDSMCRFMAYIMHLSQL